MIIKILNKFNTRNDHILVTAHIKIIQKEESFKMIQRSKKNKIALDTLKLNYSEYERGLKNILGDFENPHSIYILI